MVVSDLCQITSASNSCKYGLIQHKMFMEDPLKQEDKYRCQSLKCNLFSIILEKNTTYHPTGKWKYKMQKPFETLKSVVKTIQGEGRNYSKPKQE